MTGAERSAPERLRILVCASEAPLEPLDGLRLQVAHVLRHLADSHEICVLAYRWPEQRGEPPAGVELIALDPPSSRLPARIAGRLNALVRPEPVEVVRSVPAMRSAVERLIRDRRFDVAHVTPGQLASVAPALDETPAIVCPLDFWADSLRADALVAGGIRRLLISLNERRARRYEQSAYRPYQRVVMVSDADAAALAALDPSLNVVAIPNGVDAARFAPSADSEREPGLVVFTGHMGAGPNVLAASWLAREILPRVRSARPDARLALVGRRPAAAVRELAKLEGVEVTGEVADVRPWLWRCEAFACGMLSGTGIKNKLLEALACGAPTVATPLALKGLGVVDGEQLLVAERDLFADALVRLLSDAGVRDRLSAAGRDYVVANHGWDKCAARFEAVYREAIAAP